jgi:hypothetical protein
MISNVFYSRFLCTWLRVPPKLPAHNVFIYVHFAQELSLQDTDICIFARIPTTPELGCLHFCMGPRSRAHMYAFVHWILGPPKANTYIFRNPEPPQTLNLFIFVRDSGRPGPRCISFGTRP